MPLPVLLTDDAAHDLEELYDYIEARDSPDKAEQVLEQLEQSLAGLSDNPQRGIWPKELVSLGIREYRELFYKPYRIIYRVLENKVYVLLIADARRDMQTLLQRRLIRP
jgi:toxin ParE1/3/4